MAVIVDAATTGREHDHGGFPESGTRARLFAFFPLSVLIIHPCVYPLPSPAGFGRSHQLCDPTKAGNGHFDVLRILKT
jgi:hypothetical protein